MKVIELLKKYQLCSNAIVIIYNTDTKEVFKLNKVYLKDPDSEYINQMKINTFSVIENTLSVYVQLPNQK